MPKLIFHDSDGVDRSVDLGAEPTLIGRAAECQVQTQDALVSRRHARIVWDGGYWIEDLGSSNGVFVGGERVQRAPLRPGDEVRCGSLVMKLVPEVSRSRPNSSPPPSPSPPPPSLSLPPPPSAASVGLPPPPAPPLALPASPPPTAELPAQRRPSPAPQLAPTGNLFEEERARRVAAEDAVLQAERRAATAEGKLLDAEARATEAEQRATAAQAQAEQAAQFEQAARQAEGYRRQIEQLRAELRRVRGGTGTDDITNELGPSQVMLAELNSDRDKLRQRVAELEAQLAARAPMAAAQVTGSLQAAGGDDSAMLRRKVEQLTAELRRIRGGGPLQLPIDEGKITELETRLVRAEQERDEARRVAAAAEANASAAAAARAVVPAAPAVPDLQPEVDRLRRMVDQQNAELRRLRQGSAPVPVAEDPRIAELQARLSRAELERDAARKAAVPVAAAVAAAPAPGRGDPALLDAVAQLDDALADLRGSLRAASDELGVIGAPSDSVQVLRDALGAAGDQMETARGKVREMKTLLGGR